MHTLTTLRQYVALRTAPVVLCAAMMGPSAPADADDAGPARREIVLEAQVVHGDPPAPGVTFVDSETDAARRAMAHLLQEGRAGHLGMSAVSRGSAKPPTRLPVWRLQSLSPTAPPKAVAAALAGFEKRARRCRGLVAATTPPRTLRVRSDAHGQVTFAKAPQDAAERCLQNAFAGHRFPYRRPLQMVLEFGSPSTKNPKTRRPPANANVRTPR